MLVTLIQVPFSGACEDFRGDLVFVIDSSGSIRDNNPSDGSYDNWALMLEFMSRLVDDLDIDGGNVRVSVVKFSDIAESVFHLNDYSDKALLKVSFLLFISILYMFSFVLTTLTKLYTCYKGCRE